MESDLTTLLSKFNFEDVAKKACMQLQPVNYWDLVKQEGNCAVFESETSFCKIRRLNDADPIAPLENLIRNAFAQEYRKMGLSWDNYMFANNGSCFNVQVREKLQVVKNSERSFEEVIRESSNVKFRVQKRLEFPVLTQQIYASGVFDELYKLELVRNVKDDFSDYAWFNDEVIFLGDSNWVIVLVGNGGKVIGGQSTQCVPVSLSYGDFYFSSFGAFDDSSTVAEDLFDIANNWWLFSLEEGGMNRAREKALDGMEEMLKTNAKILAKKTAMPTATRASFGNMRQEVKGMLAGAE